MTLRAKRYPARGAAFAQRILRGISGAGFGVFVSLRVIASTWGFFER